MTAKELMRRYEMHTHVEHGAFLERHDPSPSAGRAASGLMYYYVSPGERTEFHRIDCDEYWCYAEGATLELWTVSEDGHVSTARLGTADGCEPVILVKKGMVFAAKCPAGDDGTFLSCITVPRFRQEALELFTKEELLARFPALCEFYWD